MRIDRRDFLGLGFPLVSGLARAASGQTGPALVPRVNGGVNVQPVRRLDPDAGLSPPLIEPGIVDAQMRAVYELGFEQIRVTISFERFGPDFLAAIPYARAARALGIDVVGVIGQFAGFDLVQALSALETRDEVLETYAAIFGDPVLPVPGRAECGRFAAQILNEPTHFLGLSPGVYVREYLRPAYLHLKEDDPSVTIVAAAAVGSAEGVPRTRAMLEAGLELHCDVVAYHVYGRRFLDELGGLTEKPVWVTETGVGARALHLSWFTETMPEIRRVIGNVDRSFWFDLFDLEAERFRLIDVRPSPELDGSFSYVPESTELVAHLFDNIRRHGEGPFADYRELIPDVTLYLPTREDWRRILATTAGADRWRR